MTELTVLLRGRGRSGREFQRYLLQITSNASSARRKHLSLCTILLLVGMAAYFLLYKIVMMHAHRPHGKLVWKKHIWTRHQNIISIVASNILTKTLLIKNKCPKLEQSNSAILATDTDM